MNDRSVLIAATAFVAVMGVVIGGRWLPPVACGSAADLIARCNEDVPHYAAMRRDLDALYDLQERYWVEDEHYGYTSVLGDVGFVPSPGVRVITNAAVRLGWSATLTHEALADGEGCAVYWGEDIARPLLIDEDGVGPGEVYCTPM